MRDVIADYQVLRPWGPTGTRYVARPPRRLGRDGDVLVSELDVDPEGWAPLSDWLVRMAAAGGDRLLAPIELGPDLEAGGVFLATDAAPGGSLADPAGRMDRRGRIAAVKAAAQGSHALHEAGLAHGGIHAGAIVLNAAGPVLDLPRLDARPGEVARVAAWPELEAVDPRLLDGEAPSRGSDIWALGATLHSAMSDRPLFPGIEDDEPVTAVQRVMFTRPDPDPAIPARLLEVIVACLAADPADRPSTALEVAERLAGAGAAR